MRDILKKIKWKIDFFLIKVLRVKFIFMKHRHFSNIIIFGSGRSGTTWLGEIMSNVVDSKLIDEPLKNSNSYKIDKIGLTGWGQFIPEDDTEWSEVFNYFNRLLSGREFNPNHIRNNSKLFTSKIFILKFIRANLLMPWLVNNFNVRTPIYLIRNPYAVVASRLKHAGWGLNKSNQISEGIVIPNFRYYNEFYYKYKDCFSKITRLEELLTLQWIMENEYVVNHPMNNKKWITISYEELLIYPEKTMEKIKKRLKLKIDPIDEKEFKKRSYSDLDNGHELNSKILKWKSDLNNYQIELISNILIQSKLSDIYKVDTELPNLRIYG